MADRGIVYVVDDDDAVRTSLALLLRVSGHEVRTFTSSADFIEVLPFLVPGCVLLDLRMPGVPGTDVLRRIADRRHQLPCVILTGHGDIALAVACMKGGACDFVEKPYDREALLSRVSEALDVVEAGGRPANRARSLVDALPRRQRQVLELVADGLSNKVIASKLGLSPRTVELHRSRMMERLGARNVSQTVQIAFQAGIGPVSDAVHHGPG